MPESVSPTASSEPPALTLVRTLTILDSHFARFGSLLRRLYRPTFLPHQLMHRSVVVLRRCPILLCLLFSRRCRRRRWVLNCEPRVIHSRKYSCQKVSSQPLSVASDVSA